MKLFKFVFVSEYNNYQLWFTDCKGEWKQGVTYFTTLCAPDRPGMITEMVLWNMNKYVNLGYKFIGIELSVEDNHEE